MRLRIRFGALFLFLAGLVLSSVPAHAQQLLATTNRGSLVRIDLTGGTTQFIGASGTLPGDFNEVGWTGLSFDATGNLFTIKKRDDEVGCPGEVRNCWRLFTVDLTSVLCGK